MFLLKLLGLGGSKRTKVTSDAPETMTTPAAAPPPKTWIETTLNIEASDLAGLPYSAAASMCTLGAYYYLQPLGDTLALSMGLEFTPLVTVGNMCLILIVNPIYAAGVRVLPTASVVPWMFRIVSLMLLAFAVMFAKFPDWKALSFAFAVYVGTISLFTTTTLNARLASLHSKAEAKRVYGIIAAGSQTGQLGSSLSAPILFGLLGNLVVIPAALLYEFAVQLIACRGKIGKTGEENNTPNPAADGASASEKEKLKAKEATPAAAEPSSKEEGGSAIGNCLYSMFGGFYILLSTPFLRAITGHTLLITFLVSGVWYERAAAVSNAFHTSEEQYDFFATLNAIVGTLTLIVQTLFFSHILKILGFNGTLVAEPVALMVGLITAIVHPGLLSIAILDGMRKVFHYSLVKPTKEGLYAAFPKDVVFIAKPLLDTLVYRTGSLIGAGYFTAAIKWGMTPKMRQYLLLAVAVVWAGNSWWLGVLAERHQKEQEEEKKSKEII